MAIHIEDHKNWETYQFLIKELVTNGAIDIKDFPQYKALRGNKEVSTLATPLGYLSQPQSHSFRVRVGLTVDEGRHCTGAVLRVGYGQYMFEKDQIISGARHDTLVTADEVIIKHNHRLWNFRKPKVAPAPEPEREQIDVRQNPDDPPAFIPGEIKATTTANEGWTFGAGVQPPVLSAKPEYEVVAVDAASVVVRRTSDSAIIVANVMQIIGGTP